MYTDMFIDVHVHRKFIIRYIYWYMMQRKTTKTLQHVLLYFKEENFMFYYLLNENDIFCLPMYLHLVL